MATHDYDIANGTGAAVRADLNNVLQAILTNNSSSSSPSTTAAYMFWADTTAGLLKIRNSANDAWIELLQLDGTLTMEDGSASTPAIAFRTDLNTGIFRGGTDLLDISTGGTSRAQFSSNGVAVVGGSNSFTSTGDTIVKITSANGSTAVLDLGDAADTDAGRITYDSSNNMEFSTNSSPRVRINNDGEVGIGNSDPKYQLHITKSDSTAYDSTSDNAQIGVAPTIMLENGDGTTNSFAQIAFDLADTNQSIARVVAINSGTASSDLAFVTENNNTKAEKFRIKSNGNCGIGTNDPDSIFHIKGSNPDVHLENTGTGTGQLRVGHFTNGAFIGTYNDDGGGSDILRLGVHSGDEVIRITSTKLVGIGTSNPSGSLHVLAESGIDGPVFDSGGTNNTNHALLVRDSANNQLVRVNNNGKVGIANSSPSEILHVTGNILASGTITPNSDIVFKKDVEPLQNALSKITQLLGINFTYKDNNEKSMGLVAQDVEKVYPELIRGEEGNKSLNYMGLTGAIVEAIKELSDKVAALEAA